MLNRGLKSPFTRAESASPVPVYHSDNVRNRPAHLPGHHCTKTPFVNGRGAASAIALPPARVPHPHSRRSFSCRSSSLQVGFDNGRDPRPEWSSEDDSELIEMPTYYELSQRQNKERPLVRVRLSVHYRVHSRQILCIGGDRIPFGWSFLSIAKIPMTWETGDVWTCEVELQAGQRVEYKYVILEEQDWTKLELDDEHEHQGLVEITYRSSKNNLAPPDVQAIQKQMAIVAWQPGPNRVLQVPSETELGSIQPGDVLERIAPRPNQRIPYETTGRVAPPPPVSVDPFEGTWEVLLVGQDEKPFLDRHDVWGWVPNSIVVDVRPEDNLCQLEDFGR